MIADTADIIPCIKSIAVPITNLIVLHVFLTRYSIVGQSTPHIPCTIGANLLNKSLTNVSAKSTAILIPSKTFSTTVCIALKIIAPSESHQDLTPSNCLMKKSLTVDNAWLIASFITLNCSFIESIAPVIIPIWSSVSPDDSSMLIPPASSPLNIAKIASKAVTTLSLNSITDSQAPTNLSFNPSIKFLNVSDLLYAMTKPAPSAAIAAMVKVIGLVSAPNNGANHLSSPPALVMEAINGASAPTTPETNVIILPTTINTGPAATTKPANTPITFWVVPLS